jgi:tyrosyl-tRNA synthetase
MSLSDAMMWPYFELVTDRTPEQIAAIADDVKSGTKHPMDVKMSLAKEIIAGFHGEAAAEKAAAEFQRVFRDRQAPSQIPEIRFTRAPQGLVADYLRKGELTRHIFTGNEKWSQVLSYLGEIDSVSEADRVIKQGGLEINGEVITNPTTRLEASHAVTYELRIGKKKFLRIVVE